VRLPDEVFQVDDVPHDWLFPRVAAVVHHGGAGTVGAGVAAGAPTLVVPHFADQPFWAQRIYDLEVGPKPIPRHKLSAENLARGIEDAVGNSHFRQNAAALGARVRGEDGLGQALKHLARFPAGSRLRTL
jgi:sterol 3beta-glucosyltransferase